MPNLNGGCGDLHVRVEIEVPANLSSKQKQVLEEFESLTSNSNYPEAAKRAKAVDTFYARRDALRKHTGR
jgi:molecular chaperone DnaJ